jgi:large subunit ribosomal protein L10
MARPDKVAAVEEITSRFGDSNAALLTEYRGLTVSEIAEVRGALRAADADYKVLKNTLVRIAAKDVGLEDLVGLLTGPTAIAFCRGDAVAAAKALDDAAKRFPVLVVKGGVLRGKILDADQARELARIEPREVLLAKIAMLVNQPAQQTVNVLSALLRDFGSMLAQVVEKKEVLSPPSAEPQESGEPPGGTGQAAQEEGNGASAPGGAEAQDQAPAAPEADATDATEGSSSTEEE